MSNDLWPALPYESWKATYMTLHMWTQVVGKIALAQAAPVNHTYEQAATRAGWDRAALER